jgi:hypothetical protein
MYIHICKNTGMYIDISIHVYACMNVCMYTYVHIYKYVSLSIGEHTEEEEYYTDFIGTREVIGKFEYVCIYVCMF